MSRFWCCCVALASTMADGAVVGPFCIQFSQAPATLHEEGNLRQPENDPLPEDNAAPPEENDPPPDNDLGPVGRAILVRDTGGHSAVPRQLVFTPDGKKLISTGDDRTVQVWDVETRERLRVFRLPLGSTGQGGVAKMILGTRLVVDRKGERVAFCGVARDDQRKLVFTTYVCSLQTGEVQTLKCSGPRDFSPDGKYLAVGEEHEVRLIEIATGLASQSTTNLLPADAKTKVCNLAYSPDGTRLAVVAEGSRVFVLDAATLKRKKVCLLPGSDHNLRSVCWASNQTVVCRNEMAGKALVVVEVATGELKKSYSHAELFRPLSKGIWPEFIEQQAVTGTTQVLIRLAHVADADGGVRSNVNYLLDYATGATSKPFIHKGEHGCNATAITGDLRLAAQGDDRSNDILLWNPKEGTVLRDNKKKELRLRAAVRGANGWPESIRWRPDGKGIVWWANVGHVNEGFAELNLTTLTRKSLTYDQFHKYCLELTALTRGDKPAKDREPWYWPNERGLVRKWKDLSVHLKFPNLVISGGPKPLTAGAQDPVDRDYTFLSDGRLLSYHWSWNKLQLTDSSTGKSTFTPSLTRSYIQSLALSPKPVGHYVLIGSADQTLTIYNPATNKTLLTVFPAGKDWIAWTPEGYYAATPGGERLMGWHVDNGPDKFASFYPADRFRKQLYRPDVIKLLLEKGSVEEALQAANATLKQAGIAVQDGVAKVDKLLPPVVELSVLDKSKLPVVQLKVSAKAGVKEQPITTLRLFVDGRPFTDPNATAVFAKGVPKDERAWSVELPPGTHRLTVLARSDQASGMSNEVEIDCRPPTEKPVLHVLAIGINTYEDKALTLGCAANDASLLADTFAEKCRCDLFPVVRTQKLLDEKATRKEILDAIQKLRTDPQNKVKANDLVVVFFAGHGAKEKDQFYLLPHEAKVDDLAETALSGKELRDALGAFPCQVLLMLDACHSGAFGAKGKLSAQNLRPATDDAARTFTDDEVGVAVMCAAMGNEKAEERGSNGLFTKAVVEALTANKDVPFNRVNHRQYIHHLQAYVFDRVAEESKEKQHPFLHLPWIVESFALREVAAK